jgi:hypothetical protein
MPRLDSTRDAFADRNVPLALLLGLVSLAHRLGGVATARRSSPPPGPDAREHPLLYLVLGLVSLRRTLLAELEPLREAREVRDHSVPARRPPEPPLRDLLR